MYNKCLLCKLANYCLIILPADYGGGGVCVCWHFYKSNGNHSRPTPAEAAWGRKSLWCAADFRGSPYLACTCMNPRPSFTPTHRRKNPQAKALHTRAAFPGDVRIDVLKRLWVTQIWWQEGSSKHLWWCWVGPSQVPVAMWNQKGAPSSSDSDPRPQPGAEEAAQLALHSWALLSTLPGRTTQVVKSVHSSWPGTWGRMIHISYFFGLPFFWDLLALLPKVNLTLTLWVFMWKDVFWAHVLLHEMLCSPGSLSDNRASGFIWERLTGPHISSKKLIKITVLINQDEK